MISKNFKVYKKNPKFSPNKKHKRAATEIRGAALLVNYYKTFNFFPTISKT